VLRQDPARRRDPLAPRRLAEQRHRRGGRGQLLRPRLPVHGLGRREDDLPVPPRLRRSGRGQGLLGAQLHDSQPDRQCGQGLLYITYDIDFVPTSSPAFSTITPVHPIWMDVQDHHLYPVFNVRARTSSSAGSTRLCGACSGSSSSVLATSAASAAASPPGPRSLRFPRSATFRASASGAVAADSQTAERAWAQARASRPTTSRPVTGR
jgi:hypothetical protein